MLTKHNQLVLEGDAQRRFILHQMVFELISYSWHLEEVVRDRDLIREESNHFREV